MDETTTLRTLNIEASAPPPSEARVEKPFVRIFPLALDDHGEEVLAITCRCMEQDLVLGRIDPATRQFVETHRIPKGHLDPRDKGLMVGLRMHARKRDGSYDFKTFDISHAGQQRVKWEKAEDGRRYPTYVAGPPAYQYSRLPMISVQAPDGTRLDIVDPTSMEYKGFNAVCLASNWPSKPADTQAPVLPEQGSEPDAGLDIDDLPAE